MLSSRSSRMHRIARLAGLAFIGVVLSLQAPSARPSARQQPPAQPPPQIPTFRAAVNVVRVDVIATGRDGRPVDDMTQADFEVTEDGKPQRIETFKLIQVDGIPKPGDPEPRAIRSEYDEESEAAREDVRLYAIFLDDYHVRRSSAMGVKPALSAFIQKQLAPADLCGIMYPTMAVGAVTLTRSQDSLLSAIRRFEGRKYDYQPRYPFEEKYAMYPAEVVERIRNQVTLSALRSLVVRMGSLREGRKAVILVSEGFSNTLPAQLNDPVSSLPGVLNPARGAVGRESVDDREAFLASIDLRSDLIQVYEAANRNNTAIYTLDPRGLATGEFAMTEGVGAQTDRLYLQSTLDTLRALSSETDGRAIINRNDLEAGLKQVVQDSSAYYLLGYSSTNAAADGKFHEVKVRTKRSGVQDPGATRLLGADQGGRGEGRGAAAAGGAGRRDEGARLDGRTLEGALRPQLDRHRAGAEREDAGDVRMGAAAPGARGRAQPRGDRGPQRGRGRPLLLPGPGEGRRRGRTGGRELRRRPGPDAAPHFGGGGRRGSARRGRSRRQAAGSSPRRRWRSARPRSIEPGTRASSRPWRRTRHRSRRRAGSFAAPSACWFGSTSTRRAPRSRSSPPACSTVPGSAWRTSTPARRRRRSRSTSWMCRLPDSPRGST